MKKLIQLDMFKRFKFKTKEYKRLVLKYLISNRNLSKKIRWKSLLKLQGFSKGESKISLVCRCIYTGRKYSVNKDLRLNRLEIFRRLKENSLPGYVNING